MIGQRDIAGRAFKNQPALPTELKASKAAAVKKKHNLLLAVKGLFHGLLERPAENAPVSGAKFPAHVHYLYIRKPVPLDSPGECKQFGLFPLVSRKVSNEGVALPISKTAS